MTLAKPDAIIVGSGAGGGTAAKILTDRGWTVVVLEKGQPTRTQDFLPFDELHYREHKTLIPKISDDPMIYAGLDGKTPVRSERWWEATMVGGSTMVWDANFPRYTTPDFDVLPYLKGVPNAEHMVKWPWEYRDFLPYFERAEQEWCVSGDPESPEELPPGHKYPMPPLKPHMSTEFLKGIFGPAGLQPYVSARAINSQTFEGRPACPFCGYCQFFGCAVDCRANSTNTVLRKAIATGRCELRPGHYVTRVEHENGTNGKRRATGVWYVTEPGGEEKFLGAKVVIVSVQTIQSARLFLLSGIPDPNKMIGRFLTYHAKGDGHYVFPGKPVWDPGPDHHEFQPVTAIGTLQLRGLYTYKDENGDMRKAGKFSVYDPFTCTTPIRLVKAASLGPTRKSIWGSDLIEYLKEIRSQGGVSVSFTGDAMSLYDNRVELDPETKDPWGIPVAKTFYKHDPWELAMSQFALKRISEVVVNAGGEVRKSDPQDAANPGYGHVHGSLRAGTDRGASVLTENCESHEVKGLYVLDAAWMPTAGASNPSLTLIANAIRVSDRIPKC